MHTIPHMHYLMRCLTQIISGTYAAVQTHHVKDVSLGKHTEAMLNYTCVLMWCCGFNVYGTTASAIKLKLASDARHFKMFCSLLTWWLLLVIIISSYLFV